MAGFVDQLVATLSAFGRSLGAAMGGPAPVGQRLRPATHVVSRKHRRAEPDTPGAADTRPLIDPNTGNRTAPAPAVPILVIPTGAYVSCFTYPCPAPAPNPPHPRPDLQGQLVQLTGGDNADAANRQADQVFQGVEAVTSKVPVVGTIATGVLKVENAIADAARSVLGLSGDPFPWVGDLRAGVVLAQQKGDLSGVNAVLDRDPSTFQIMGGVERDFFLKFRDEFQRRGLWSPADAVQRNAQVAAAQAVRVAAANDLLSSQWIAADLVRTQPIGGGFSREELQ